MKKIVLINYSYENGDGLTIDASMLHEIDKDVNSEDYAEFFILSCNEAHAGAGELFSLIYVNDSLADGEIEVLKKYIYFYSA